MSERARLMVRSWPLGPFATNCYLLWAEAGGAESVPFAAWIIDPGFEPDAVLAEVKQRGLRVERIILTHTHGDHIAGVREVMAGCTVDGVRPRLLVHALEAHWLNDPVLNLSDAIGMPVTAPMADDNLADGQLLALGDKLSGLIRFEVLHTPGHSPGSVSLWCGDAGAGVGAPAPAGLVIAGDTLFAGSIGRTDFPGADHATLVRSIRERLYTLPPGTRVLPGHGPETTVGHERLTNPFVRG